jgi:hypothetical protein
VSRVIVHIDRLVVRGPADARAVEAAVRDAITRELSRPDAVERVMATGSRAAIDAGSVTARAGPSALGDAIGRSVAGSGKP